ncbi:MAG: hypothetical protein AAGG01_14030, partial [Planctomycetota bacterium]
MTDDGDVDALVASAELGQVLLLEGLERSTLGDSYCGPAVRNSTGIPGRILAEGIDEAPENVFRLVALDLPAFSTTLFLASRDAGFVASPAGSLGNLCLGGAVGRFARNGEPG